MDHKTESALASLRHNATSELFTGREDVATLIAWVDGEPARVQAAVDEALAKTTASIPWGRPVTLPGTIDEVLLDLDAGRVTVYVAACLIHEQLIRSSPIGQADGNTEHTGRSTRVGEAAASGDPSAGNDRRPSNLPELRELLDRAPEFVRELRDRMPVALGADARRWLSDYAALVSAYDSREKANDNRDELANVHLSKLWEHAHAAYERYDCDARNYLSAEQAIDRLAESACHLKRAHADVTSLRASLAAAEQKLEAEQKEHADTTASLLIEKGWRDELNRQIDDARTVSELLRGVNADQGAALAKSTKLIEQHETQLAALTAERDRLFDKAWRIKPNADGEGGESWNSYGCGQSMENGNLRQQIDDANEELATLRGHARDADRAFDEHAKMEKHLAALREENEKLRGTLAERMAWNQELVRAANAANADLSAHRRRLEEVEGALKQAVYWIETYGRRSEIAGVGAGYTVSVDEERLGDWRSALTPSATGGQATPVASVAAAETRPDGVLPPCSCGAAAEWAGYGDVWKCGRSKLSSKCQRAGIVFTRDQWLRLYGEWPPAPAVAQADEQNTAERSATTKKEPR